jgi:hypothetical protein
MPDKLIKTALSLVLFISIFACSSLTPVPAPTAADIEKEEQAVYSFFVGKSPVLILQNTSTDISDDDPQQMMDYIKSGLENVSSETIDAYLTRNEQITQLAPDMNLGVEYTLISPEELAEISSQPNWGERLAEKYPGAYGYTIFSRVGFNNSLDQALIYVGFVGGPLFGSGSYYLMEKRNGEWLMMDEINVWIS